MCRGGVAVHPKKDWWVECAQPRWDAATEASKPDNSPATCHSVQCRQQMKYCHAARAQYQIQPGKSFGTMPNGERESYLAARCYR